jgi:hypothetical protein
MSCSILIQLFGASKLGLKVVEVPIRYVSRTYGETKISRFRHGLWLLRMVWFAFLRIKALAIAEFLQYYVRIDQAELLRPRRRRANCSCFLYRCL